MIIIKSIINSFPQLLIGAKVTLLLGALGILFSLFGGIIVYYARIAKHPLIRYIGEFYFEFMRNTPLLIHMLLIYFGATSFNLDLGAFESALIAITLQYSAVFSELYRSAINSIPLGQHDASASLGLTNIQKMRLVIFPQAFKRAIPWLSNEVTLLIKDTSVASGISLMELTLTGRILSERMGDSFIIFLGIAIIYIVINGIVSLTFKFFEEEYN